MQGLKLATLQNVAPAGRVPRKPTHRFRVNHKPWEIQMCAIMPVLPGETMKNAALQSRCVTHQLAAPLVGWFLEYYFFYVKHRQLGDATYMNMMLDPTITAPATAVSARDYYDGRGHNWAGKCLEVITREWFREEGEAWDAHVIRAGRPAARINQDGMLESFRRVSSVPTGGTVPSAVDDAERLKEVYDFLRAQAFTKMSYEDFLASYGVEGSPTMDRDRPELLRYIRDWQYPTNTVEPTTGVPSTALSWSVAERLDKDRFFTEPGFVCVLSVARPKVYLTNQTATGVSMLDRAMRWLPAIMRDEPETSLVEFLATEGPLGKTTGGLSEGHWLDVRDLFLYGDQWIDAAAELSGVALPTVAGVHRYATETMADALFSGANRFVRQDGVVNAHILGTQMDHT